MTNPEIIEAVAVPVDAELAPFGAFGAWLGECAERVDAVAAKYAPATIETEAEYKQAKKGRADVRRERAAIDAERKAKLRDVEDALRELKAQVKDVLVPLDALDAQFRSLMDDYERRQHERRKAALRAEYDDYELADLVPFERFAAKFDPEARWYMRSVSDAMAADLMREAMRRVAEDWATIEAFAASEGDKAILRTTYLAPVSQGGTDMELGAAIKHLQAVQREREAAEAWEREQVEIARAAKASQTQQEAAGGPITLEPVPTPSPAVIAAQRAAESFQPVPVPQPARREPAEPTHVVVIKCSEREAALIDAYARNEIVVASVEVFPMQKRPGYRPNTHVFATRCSGGEAALLGEYARNEFGVASNMVARIPAGTRPTIQFRKEN